MNEFWRLIRKGVNIFGYDLKQTPGYSLRVFRDLPKGQDPADLKTAWKALSNRTQNNDLADCSKLTVYFRTCLRANRNIDTAQRLTGASLKETCLRCLESSVTSVNHAAEKMGTDNIRVVVLDDRSDPEPLADIKNVFSQLICAYEVRSTTETGQGKSLHEQFMDGRGQNNLVYFCEDDYLHEVTGIYDMWKFYQQIYETAGTHCVLYTQEHPVLYAVSYPSYLVLGENRHWRTISHATHTFFTHGKVVEKYWNYFENTKFVGNKKKRRKGSEAQTTNKLFNQIPGFSPIEPVACHLQFDDTIPPLYDWRKLWDQAA